MIKQFRYTVQTASKSDTILAIAALFSTNVWSSIIGVLGAFIQGRFVSPEDLGFFRQFGIISGYLFFLHLGVFHAIERMYPYFLGRGEKDKAVKIVEVGNSWILMVCGPLCSIFFIVSLICFSTGNWKSGLGWLAQVIALFSTLYGGFLCATYRSGQDFKQMAKAQIMGPIGMLITLPIFWIQSYVALFLKSTISVISLWPLYKNRPLKVSLRFRWKEWKQLVAQGLPRFTASYMTTTGLDALRATIILKQLGITQLGYWSFSWMLIMMAMQLPQAITAVFIPKIIETFGKTNSPSEALTLARKPVISGGIALSIIMPIVVFGTIKVLPLLLPLYADTAGVIAVLLLSIPLKLIEAPASVLNAMNRLVWINIIAITNSFIQVIIMSLGIYFGWGLYSVAFGFFVGNLARVIMITIILRYECYLEKKALT